MNNLEDMSPSKNREGIPISVVMPSFNHGRYIEKAIKSVIQQTFINWELLIVDNHSNDNTNEVLASFSDSRIRIYKIHNDGSIAASRNKGITESKGEWIAFLDSDDFWSENKLEKCLPHLSKYDFIYHPLRIITEDLDTQDNKINLITSRKLKSPILKDLILNGNSIANSSVLTKKSILKEVGMVNTNMNINAVCDYNTWLRIAIKSEKFFYLDEALGSYRIHESNVSKEKSFRSTIPAISEFFPQLTAREIKKYLAKASYEEAKWHYSNGNFKEAKLKNHLFKNGTSSSLFFKALFLKFLSAGHVLIRKN